MKSLYIYINIILIILHLTNACFANTSNKPNKRINVIHNLHSSKILEICNSYIENKDLFRYGYKYGAFRKEIFPIDGRYEINCSTFSMLIALGISLENSKYNGNENTHIFQNSYTEDILKWFSDSTQIKYSRDIAKKMHIDGYTLTPNQNFSNLRSGDILFYNLNQSNDRPGIDFMGIDHSAIFGYQFGDKYIIYEVGDDNGPHQVLKTKESMAKVVLVGRMPYKVIQNSEPTILEYNNNKKKLNLIGNEKMNYNLAELSFKAPLKKGQCYTLLVNAYLEDGIWLNATYNNTSHYAFNLTNIRNYRPKDNIYQIYFIAPDNIMKLSVNVRSNIAKRIITDYHSCIIYNGFITKD